MSCALCIERPPTHTRLAGAVAQYVVDGESIARKTAFLKKAALSGRSAIYAPRLAAAPGVVRAVPAALPPRLFPDEAVHLLVEVRPPCLGWLSWLFFSFPTLLLLCTLLYTSWSRCALLPCARVRFASVWSARRGPKPSYRVYRRCVAAERTRGKPVHHRGALPQVDAAAPPGKLELQGKRGDGSRWALAVPLTGAQATQVRRVRRA